MQSGIYKITNKNDGKVYVGSGVNIAERWRAHKKLLRGNRHTNVHLQNAWNTHGADAFDFQVIAECARSEVLVREQEELDKLFGSLPRGDIYNVARFAAAPGKGVKPSAETLAKRSAALRGMTRSDEARANMSAAQKGRTVSAETRRRISESKSGDKHPRWGKPTSTETKAKLRAANLGRVVSEETCRRISESKSGQNKGRKIPPDVIAKRVASRLANKLLRGKTHGQ